MNDNDTLKEIAKAIASTVLAKLSGRGAWYRTEDGLPKFMPIKNPLPDLECGDVVYSYDDDREALERSQVIAVVDGIGYVLWVSGCHGPLLVPVDSDCYGRTMAEAAKVNRESIEATIAYSQGLSDRTRALKDALDMK